MIRIIGDIHGDFDTYINLIKDVDYSIQVGDFGFYKAWNSLRTNYLTSTSFLKHKILPGNHDDYNYIKTVKPLHNLGDFGEYELGGMKFFFVRGGLSIDKEDRIVGVSWWDEEELSYIEMEKAINLYKEVKPEIMITHTFPDEEFFELFPGKWRRIPSITGNGLQSMFDIYQPRLWIFSHMHPRNSFIKVIKGTIFVCLEINGFIDFNPSLSIIENINNFQKNNFYSI